MKNKIYKNLKVSPIGEERFVLNSKFTYKEVTVPKGFTTDGASIPRLLWSIWPPNNPDYLPASVIHDYLCQVEDYKKADEYFKELLEILEINKFTIFCFYYGVLYYHKIRYNI